MKKLASILSLSTIAMGVFAQFNGVIEFDKIKKDTTLYTYYIKDKMVRVEEKGTDGTIKGIMLVNTEAGTVTALSPERKLYMDVTNSKGAKSISPKIEKTTNTKKIKGYTCTEYIVRDKGNDVEISYWVAGNDFDFFIPLLTTMNRKDNLSRYFLEVEGMDGLFPIEGIERNSEGVFRNELIATKIEAKALRGAMFEIPKGYVKFEK